MNRTVYFADKSVTFSREIPSGDSLAVVDANREGISRTKITKILETSNTVVVIAHDPDAAFDEFAADFISVEAAGGIVENERGEWLMILRNGRWDFPKGHLECGERIDECAAREIAEETGIRAEIVRELCETLHAYYFPKTSRWEMKRTHWYRLRALPGGDLCPQREEGIERAAWCSPSEIAANLRGAFPTIRCVARAMQENES